MSKKVVGKEGGGSKNIGHLRIGGKGGPKILEIMRSSFMDDPLFVET